MERIGDVAPRTVFEAFGHNETCAKWREHAEGQSLDRMTLCTCGRKELTEQMRALIAATARKRTEKDGR